MRLVPSFLTCSIILATAMWAQDAPTPKTEAPGATPKKETTLLRLPRNLVTDQAVLWTSPARTRPSDANWLVPIGLMTGSMIASDHWVPRTLDLSTNTNHKFDQFANAGLAGMAAGVGGMYLLGHIRHDEHQRQAGFLAGEALIDSLAVGQILKVGFGRERPGEGSGANKFWHSGNSFPSDHALMSWSAAAALTEAYPGWGSKLLFYGGASAISLSRVLANKHAPSDVVIGGTLGYLIGKKVYRQHTADLDEVGKYGTFKRSADPATENSGSPTRGSSYVPLDSWVYPVFDRLIAMGYVKSAMLGLRPWTRSECERLINEVSLDEISGSSAEPLVSALRTEFPSPNAVEPAISAELESLYVRTLGIAGKPLTDDLNFGSTVVNDFGRPFQEGFNPIAGGSAHAEIGPLAFYVRGEYQHSPEAPPFPLSARLAIQHATQNGISGDPPIPVPPDIPIESVNRLHLLDAYVAWRVSNWELSFGKQTLWWGPGAMGGMLISDNIDPITMARLTRVEPFTLPWLFKLLGPIRTEFFIGRLGGHHFVHVSPYTMVGNYSQPLTNQPYITGQKLSLKPTPNLEIGVARTGIFGAAGFPVTPGGLRHVLFSTSTSNSANQDPGDRRTSFDFNYRLPGLRKWAVLYADSMAEDEPDPIAYPRRSAINPGIYLPQLPKLNKMELRAEASYTDLPGLRLTDYFYWNLRYISGYTNEAHLIGNWVGRQGKALQFSSRYSFAPRNTLEVTYRKLAINPDTGRRGIQQSIRAKAEWLLSPNLQASAWMQQEHWNIPVLSTSAVSNTSVGVQLTYTPKWRFTH